MRFVQPKQREPIKPVHLGFIALLALATGTTAGLSQSTSSDRAYKGSLECTQSGLETIRMPLAFSIRDGRLISSSLDLHGRQVGPEIVPGTVNPDGTFHVDYIEYTRKYSTHVNYGGTLDGTGGTLTGTQISTPEITGAVVTQHLQGYVPPG